MKDKCKNCNKRTKYMYSFNEGVYCDKCKEIGFIIQKYNLETEQFKERMRIRAESWSKPVLFNSINA